MAVTEQRQLPPQFVEDLGTDLAKQIVAQSGVPVVAPGTGGISQLAGETAADFAARQSAAQQFDIRQQSLAGLAPQVAGQDPLQQQAQTLATQGIGSYQPFVQAAQAATGPQAYQQFMSPYQSQVIDATLAEFDRNQAIKEQKLRDQQTALGVLGSGRAGVQLAEFGTGAARERALLQAGLLQEGFGQAQKAAQQQFTNQMGLASLVPGFQRADVSQLGTLGAINQAQRQAELDATREAARQAAFQPQEQLDRYSAQVTGLMGGYPGGTTQSFVPNPTPLQTALGIGTTLAGLYIGRKDGGRAAYKDGTGKEGIMKMAEIDPLQDEYEQYVFEMKEMGKEPMSFESFKRMVLAGQG
jgi:hypothetical protein